jgi:hypothetical protein
MLKVLCAVVETALLLVGAMQAQTSPASPSSFVGCVQRKGDIYTLTDESSNTTVQLRGGGLRAGRHVRVTGSMAASATPAAGATQVIDVASVKRDGGSCSAPASGNSGKSFLSRGTVASIAVIGGVAIVAIVATVGRLGEARGGK